LAALSAFHSRFFLFLAKKEKELRSNLTKWFIDSNKKINVIEISRAAAIQRFKDSESEILNYLMIL